MKHVATTTTITTTLQQLLLLQLLDDMTEKSINKLEGARESAYLCQVK